MLSLFDIYQSELYDVLLGDDLANLRRVSCTKLLQVWLQKVDDELLTSFEDLMERKELFFTPRQLYSLESFCLLALHPFPCWPLLAFNKRQTLNIIIIEVGCINSFGDSFLSYMMKMTLRPKTRNSSNDPHSPVVFFSCAQTATQSLTFCAKSLLCSLRKAKLPARQKTGR